MGMNIYTLDGKHIGKRFAAGIWCWECKVPVITEEVDLGSGFMVDIPKLPFKCPNCGLELKKNKLRYNSAFRELGFDESAPKKHTGIDCASGFTWYGKDIETAKKSLKRRRFVKTEYDERWTIKQFWEMFNDIITEKCLDCWFR